MGKREERYKLIDHFSLFYIRFVNGTASLGDSQDDAGTQIDLLIIRKDNVVNLCEMKFYSEEFTVDKSYHNTLIHRQNLLSERIPQKTVIHPTLISTYGIKYNEYSSDFVKVLTMDCLFVQAKVALALCLFSRQYHCCRDNRSGTNVTVVQPFRLIISNSC